MQLPIFSGSRAIMRRNARHAFLIALALVTGGCVTPAPAPRASAPPPASTRVALMQPMPSLDGAHLRVTVLEVRYAPGESSAPHTHSCPVIGYVTEGAIRTRTRDNAEAVYRAGETFYEPPNGVHEVSANASATQPAALLATFVCDHEGPLGGPVHSVGSEGLRR